jgi:RimJ/RimL family protein N-acetyltransferase
VSDLQRLNQQIRALYTLENGFICTINETGYPPREQDPAPRFFMGRTNQGNLWYFRHDLPTQVQHQLHKRCQAEPPYQEGQTLVQHKAILAILEQHQPVQSEHIGSAYWLPPQPMPTKAVLIGKHNAAVLEAHFPWKLTSRNSFQTAPLAATIVQGAAVSICYCARLTEQVAEAGVDTTETARGQGYAVLAVQAWAAHLQTQGIQPLYSTSWDNAASQRVARKLGAEFYAENWSVE